MEAELESDGSYVGWALWKGDKVSRFEAGRTKSEILTGYGVVAFQGQNTQEERLYSLGLELLRTRVSSVSDASSKNTAWMLAQHGKLVPKFLSWTSLKSDPESAKQSAIWFMSSHGNLSEEEQVELRELQCIRTVDTGALIARRKGDQKRLDQLWTRVNGWFDRDGFSIVRVKFERLETDGRFPAFALPEGWRLKRRHKVDLWDMVDSCWNTWQKLETFAYLARLSREGEDGCSGPFELLSVSSAVNLSAIHPLGSTWRKDLDRRWEHVLLHRVSGDTKAWKDQHKIALENHQFLVNYPTAEEINPPYWLPNGKRALSHSDQLSQLLNDRGWLAWCLNECHDYAIRIQGVHLNLGPDGASVSLEYGMDGDSSSWRKRLAFQKPGEPLIFVIQRAQQRLDQLKDPNAEPPLLWRGKPAKPSREARSLYAEWNPSKWISEWTSHREFCGDEDSPYRIDDC